MLGPLHDMTPGVACRASVALQSLRDTLHGPLVGYARYPRNGQRLDRQIDALRVAGCTSIESDVASGNAVFRPGLEAALDQLGEGSGLVVQSLECLAWREDQLRDLFQAIHERSAHLISLAEGFDSREQTTVFRCAELFTRFAQRVRLARAGEAQAERVDLRRKISDETWSETELRIQQGELSVAAAAKALNVARSTIYRRRPDFAEARP